MKRRAAFLAKTVPLKRFTKRVIVSQYGISEREFDELVASGFLKEDPKTICSDCYRPWTGEADDACLYCGHDESHEDTNFYAYGTS